MQGMRHLPHFVASAEVGREAEDADALLAGKILFTEYFVV
jgi:hypothetical protein